MVELSKEMMRAHKINAEIKISLNKKRVNRIENIGIQWLGNGESLVHLLGISYWSASHFSKVLSWWYVLLISNKGAGIWIQSSGMNSAIPFITPLGTELFFCNVFIFSRFPLILISMFSTAQKYWWCKLVKWERMANDPMPVVFPLRATQTVREVSRILWNKA